TGPPSWGRGGRWARSRWANPSATVPATPSSSTPTGARPGRCPWVGSTSSASPPTPPARRAGRRPGRATLHPDAPGARWAGPDGPLRRGVGQVGGQQGIAEVPRLVDGLGHLEHPRGGRQAGDEAEEAHPGFSLRVVGPYDPLDRRAFEAWIFASVALA